VSSLILIDSGATSNFLSQDYALKHNLSMVPLPEPIEVRMANGHQVACTMLVADVLFETGTHSGIHDFIVLPVLDEYDVICGRKFLKRSRAIVDHDLGVVSFRSNASSNRKVKLARMSSESVKFSRKVADLVEGHVVGRQDQILRAHGLAAAPVGVPVVADDASAHGLAAAPVGVPVVADDSSAHSLAAAPVDVAVVADYARAHGLAAAPVGVEIVAEYASVPSNVLAQVMEEVRLYGERMAPFIGKLPPSRPGFDHSITLVHESISPKARRAIPLNSKHTEALAAELAKLTEAGCIRVSRSEWAAPVFFVPKNETEDRMVCDYRALNSVTVTNNASLPYVKELFARVKGARVFTKMDMLSGYHQLRLRESDVALTGFITPLGHFEWLVMPFGEKNAAASFTQLMSQLVLRDLIHAFVIVYQDDLLIASQNEADHPSHVKQVLERLSDHQLWIKPEKCEWAVRECDFLGHHIRVTEAGTVVEPMESKVAAVTQWPVPVNTNELRSFLGLGNYYRDFVQDFSAIAAPLTALTGQRVEFIWSSDHQLAFDNLKLALGSAPALLAVDDAKPFTLHCDASTFAVGAVLSQNDDSGRLRPVGFFSRKLTDTQLRWDVYQCEIYSVVAALEHWQMHLKGARVPVQIYTDHRSLEELDTQLLSPKMARWFTTLSDYRYKVTWIPGAENGAADALSRRPDHDDGSQSRQLTRTRVAQQLHQVSGNSLGPGTAPASSSALAHVSPTAIMRSSSSEATEEHRGRKLQPSTECAVRMTSVHALSSDVRDRIRNLYLHDSVCQMILADPLRHGYFVEDGLLLRHADYGILVPENEQLRRDLLHESHDTPTSGHLGSDKTLARIREVYYWPGLSRDVSGYVARCGACQRNKGSTTKPGGLMQSIPIVDKGEMITVDFVGALPRSRRGMNCILVAVDKMSKRAYYEPCRTTVTAAQAANMIFRRVVREQGLPATIVSDRDARFTSAMWRQLWAECGTKLGLATAYHQQTDGQSERQVRTLEESLRSFVNTAGNDWDERLVHIEIAHNTSKHASTGFAPLKLHSGVSASLPISVNRYRDPSAKPTTASRMVSRMREDIDTAKLSLELAQTTQKLAYDRRHRQVEYSVGEFAFLSTADRLNSKGGMTVWKPRFEGPYRVTQVSGNGLNVTLDIPNSALHCTFHVSKLKKAIMPLNESTSPQSNASGPSTRLTSQANRVPTAAALPCDQTRDSSFQLDVPTLVVGSDDFTEDVSGHNRDRIDSDEVLQEESSGDPGSEHSSSTESEDERDEVELDVVSDDQPAVRRSGRQRVIPDRLIHSNRLGDQFRLNTHNMFSALPMVD
jgi:hypothetical protein